MNVMFSSQTYNWATPQWLFDELDKVFSFTLDPCASAENAKCEKYYTREQDGLKQNWGGRECSAILHTGKRLENGLPNVPKKQKSRTLYV